MIQRTNSCLYMCPKANPGCIRCRRFVRHDTDSNDWEENGNDREAEYAQEGQFLFE